MSRSKLYAKKRVELKQLEISVLSQAATVQAESQRLQELQRLGQSRAGDGRLSAKRRSLENARVELSNLKLELDKLKREELKDSYEEDFKSLSHEHPIVLLPVRLETRFKTKDESLWIRIYPDDIHVDQFDQTLLAGEVKLVEEVVGNDSLTDKKIRENLLQQLTLAVGPARAAWVLRHCVNNKKPDVDDLGEQSNRVARATALPDCFVAIGIRDGKKTFIRPGKTLTSHLPVGPDPLAPIGQNSSKGQDDTLIDPGLNWLSDFSVAEEKGLGIIVPYSEDKLLPSKGLDQLIVVGVISTLLAEEGVGLIEELFTSHRYSKGLGFVAQGTPTNNTGESASGYNRSSTSTERVVQDVTELQNTMDKQANSKRFARALGVTDKDQQHYLFDQAENAELTEYRDAVDMNTVLWSVTGGYFLEQMLRPLRHNLSVNRRLLSDTKSHFIWNVSGRGPLTAFRIGDQPYGILPVLSVPHWAANNPTESEFESKVLSILLELRDQYWQKSAIEEVFAGLAVQKTPGDPQQGILDALSLQAVSDRYSVHPMLGPEFTKNLVLLHGADSPEVGIFQGMLELASENLKRVLNTLGLSIPDTVLGECIHAICDYSISNAIVQKSDQNPEDRLDPGYINWLLDASLEDIIAERGVDAIRESRGVPLLYLMLRHAVLLELGRGGVETLQLDEQVLREPELPGFSTGGNAAAKTVFDILREPVAGTTLTVGEHLLQSTRQRTPSLPSQWKQFWSSLQALSKLSVQQLDLLSRETLDCFSSRLDAWFTSLAASRLNDVIDKEDSGRWIGAYGFVENLKPRDSESEGERESPVSVGYVHAPSLNQAATAAVVLNGQLTHRDGSSLPSDDGPLSIQLNSTQVQRAESLADGLRQGYLLGELLGYQFERTLRLLNLHRYIHAFRTIYPVKSNLHESSDDPSESNVPSESYAGTVVDGLALLRDYQANDFTAVRLNISGVGSEYSIPLRGGTTEALIRTIDEIESQVKALNDALVIESVHQLIQGNPERSGAALAAMSGTGTPPPELLAMKTQRSGVALHYRVIDAWTTGIANKGPSELSLVSPDIEKWCSTWFGNLETIGVGLQNSTEEPIHFISLDDMQISVLDLLYLSTGDEINRSWIEYLALRWATENIKEFSDTANPTIFFEPYAEMPDGVQCIGEAVAMVGSIRNVLGAGRPLSSSDLSSDEGATNVVRWSAKLTIQRLTAAESGLKDLLVNLQKIVADLDQYIDVVDDEVAADLESLLESAIRFAIPEALETIDDSSARLRRTGENGDRSAEQLRRRAQSVIDAVDVRISNFQKYRVQDFPDSIDQARFAQLNSAVGDLFGKEIPLTLPMQLSTGLQTELPLALDRDNSNAIQGADANASELWMHDVACVRQRVQFYDELRRNHAIARRQPLPLLTVSHLPYEPGARWCALPQRDRPIVPTLSLVAGVHEPISRLKSFQLVGWMIDEWQELIPSEKETSGMSFHFDSPASQAPNVVLMAMPGSSKGNWSLEELTENILEATRSMKLRAVAANQLDGLGQLLPALVLPENVRNATASSDLKRARPESD